MDTLDKLKDSALIIKTNKRIKSNTAVLVGEHLQTINKMFEELMMFVFVDKDGNETSDATKAIAIKPRSGKGFFSESFISAYGINSEGGGDGGSTVQWNQIEESGKKIAEILIDGISTSVYAPDGVKAWTEITGKPSWIGDSKPTYTASEVGAISSVTSKMVTDALGYTPYNSTNPNSYISGITSAMVENALGFTPYDSASFTKANIKSTLGISDWALGATKPTYNLDEVEDGTTRKLSNYLLKSTFDELFEKVTANGVTYIKAKFGLVSDDFISAYGVNSSGGSGGGTNVSFAQTLTSGTEIATITIEGIATKIYAPTIPTWATLSGKPTTLGGYGITDAKIANGVITLGSNTITPLTSHQSLANYVQTTDSRLSDSRNAKDVYAWAKASTKPSYNFSEIGSKPTTISGYGITDAITTGNIGSQSVASAAKLTTARTLWGKSFNGSANVSGEMSSVTNIDSLLYFDTTNSRVGIGIAEPQRMLHLHTTEWRTIRLNRSSNTAGAAIEFSNNTGTIGSFGLTHNSNGYFYQFVTYTHSEDANGNDVETGTIQAVVRDSGNFGIGTTEPTEKLEVNGTAKVTSLKIGGATLTWDATNKCIKVDKGFASDDFISAYGANNSGGGSGGSVVSYTATQTNGTALGTLTIDGVNKTIYAPSLSGYATQSWVGQQGYLTQHQSLANYVQTTDSRLSDSRNAKDVYAWAKAATKPSYNFSEIGSKPTTISGYGITDAITTGNIGSQSVASASKITNARTLWGNSFDGSSDISDNLVLPNNKSIRVKDTTGAEKAALYLSSGNNLFLGYGTSAAGYYTYIEGTEIIFRYNNGSGSHTEAMRLSGGSLGLGTSSPTTKLHIYQSAWDNGLTLQRSVEGGGASIKCRDGNGTDLGNFGINGVKDFEIQNNSVTNVIVKSNGNVGIGTTAPTTKLHIVSGVFDNLELQRNHASNGVGIRFSNNSGLLGKFGYTGGYFDWENASGTKMMALTSDGKLGIGNTAPTDTLDVNGGMSIGYSAAGAADSSLNLRRNSFNYIWATTASGALVFGTNAVSKSLSNASMAILANGRVGIGSNLTSAAITQALYVNGNILASGEIAAYSDIRKKKLVEYHTLSLDSIAEAPLFTFHWNDREDKSEHLGTSAQYWQKVTPWLVQGEDILSLNYSALGVAMGISLAKNVVDHEARIKALENENEELKRKLKMIA